MHQPEESFGLAHKTRYVIKEGCVEGLKGHSALCSSYNTGTV